MHSSFLRYLDEVARQGSIRKAANFLNVSSTSVNRKIIHIEKRLGTKLFERSSEGVELTAAGAIVLEHCRKTLYEFDKIKVIIDDIRDLKTGHLSIQTIDSVTFGVLPQMLEIFGDRYPGITLSVNTASPDDVSAAVIAGESDMGITFTRNVHADLQVFAEKSAPFGIVVRSDHPLAGRTSVSVKDIAAYPLVRTIDARSGHSILDQETEFMETPLSTYVFTNALVVAKHAILANKGIGVYTKVGFLHEIEQERLTFVPLSVQSLEQYKIGVITAASSSIDPVKRLFIDAAERVFKSVNFDS